MKNVYTRAITIVVASYFLLSITILSTELSAQNILTAVKRSDLSIGNINVGQSLQLLPQSPAAAKFEVRSTSETDIVIQIVLPHRLQEIGGRNELGVTFGLDCARWSLHDNVENSTSFDPHLPVHVHIDKNQSVIVWLGAFVEPPQILQAGRYIGSITLTATPGVK